MNRELQQRIVLGWMIEHPEVVHQTLDTIPATAFDGDHRNYYNAIKDLTGQDRDVFLHLENHRLVKDSKLMVSDLEISYNNNREGVDEAYKALQIPRTPEQVKADNPPTKPNYWLSFLNELQEGRTTERVYYKFGIEGLDDLVWLRSGKSAVVAARTAQGKTSLMVHMMITNVKRNRRCLYLTNEMSQEEIVGKIISSQTGIDSIKYVVPKQLTEDDWDSTNKMTGEWMVDKKEFIDIQVIPKFEMDKINKMIDDFKPELVFVDYIQRFNIPGRQSRAAEFSEIANSLKTVAMEKKVCIVSGSQVSRGVDLEDKELELCHLKESGGLEEAADACFLVWANSTNEQVNQMNIKVAKNRTGKCGKVLVEWHKHINHWIYVEPTIKEQ